VKSDHTAAAIDSAGDSLLAARLNAHLQSYSEGRTTMASQLNDLKQKQQLLNSRYMDASLIDASGGRIKLIVIAVNAL
jgi:hypothetical protein